MTIVLTGLNPALSDWRKDVVLEITGSGFTANSDVTLISPTNPPVLYSLGSATLISGSVIRINIAGSSVPIGIYDVRVSNGSDDLDVLTQSYRSAPTLPPDPFTSQTFDNIMARWALNLNPVESPFKYRSVPGSVPWVMAAPMAVIISEIYQRVLFNLLKLAFPQYQGGALLELSSEASGVIKKANTFATGVMEITAPVGTILPLGLRFSSIVVANSPTPPITAVSTETSEKVEKTAVTGTATSATTSSITDTTKAFITNEWLNHYIFISGGTGVGQIRRVDSNTATVVNIVGSWDVGKTPDNTSTYRLLSGVAVRAEQPGEVGNVSANSVTRLISTANLINAVNNPANFDGGASAETDQALLSRLLLSVRSPTSGGNIFDYERWAAEAAGVNLGPVSILPLWNGNGTVKVVIINSDNSIPGTATIAAVQNYLDPIAGQGKGKAPIGHVVTVVAATSVAVDVSVTLTVDVGVSASAIRSQVTQSIQNYLNNIPTGGNVILTQIENAIINSGKDISGKYIRNTGVIDFDLLSSGHGIKRSGSPTWTTTNITMAGTEKPVSGSIQVS